MQFQAGQTGNPAGRPRGRPKGSVGGRMKALMLLDKMLVRKRSQALMAALEKELQEDPLGFFKSIIMPLLPKESKLAVEKDDGILVWKSLVEAFPKPEVPAAPPNEG